jgi:predicted transposase YdaD
MPAPEPQSRFLNTLERRAARRGRQEGEKHGRQEGRQEGRHEATRELVVRLLTLRFGELPEPARAAIAAAPTHRLDTMVDSVLTASTLDEVLA